MDQPILYNEGAYWEAVRQVVSKVFQADPGRVAALQSEVSALGPEERLAMYHTAPIRVAADLLGVEIEEQHIEAYRRLIGDTHIRKEESEGRGQLTAQ